MSYTFENILEAEWEGVCSEEAFRGRWVPLPLHLVHVTMYRRILHMFDCGGVCIVDETAELYNSESISKHERLTRTCEILKQ
jgi:hypothetical protein